MGDKKQTTSHPPRASRTPSVIARHSSVHTPLIRKQNDQESGSTTSCWGLCLPKYVVNYHLAHMQMKGWRSELLKFMHSSVVQDIILFLLMLDIVIVCAEVAIDEMESPVPGWVDVGLEKSSMTILIFFAIEIFLYMVATGPSFFCQPLEVLDMIVVGGSIYQDMEMRESTSGRFLILLRLWRLGRIFHGVWEAEHEITERKLADLEAHVKCLESENKQLVKKLRRIQAIHAKDENSPYPRGTRMISVDLKEDLTEHPDIYRIFRLATEDYPCVAVRAQPDIRSARGRDVGANGHVIEIEEEVEGEDGNIYLRIVDGDGGGWVFMFDFDDDTLKANKTRKLLEELVVVPNFDNPPFEAVVLEDYIDETQATGHTEAQQGEVVRVLEVKEDQCLIENNYDNEKCWIPLSCVAHVAVKELAFLEEESKDGLTSACV